MVTKKCTDCPRQAPDDRKLCWHCSNFKYRYGMTDSGVIAMRKLRKVCCEVCEQIRNGLQPFRGITICARCMGVVFLLERPGLYGRVSKLVSSDCVIDTGKDAVVEPIANQSLT